MKNAPEPSSFGQRLKWIRQKYDLTLEQFGDRLGVGASYLSKLETGKRESPSNQFLYLVSNTFHVRKQWLISGEGDPFSVDALNATAEHGSLSVPSTDIRATTLHTVAGFHKAGEFLLEQPTINDLAEAIRIVADELAKEFSPARVVLIRVLAHELNEQLELFSAANVENKTPIVPTAEPLSKLGQYALMTVAETQNPTVVETSNLTYSATRPMTVDMAAQWPALKKRLQKATEESGKTSALAKFLKVKLSRVSQWLSDSEKTTREPGAEYALQMLQWVEQQERQQNAPNAR